MAYYETFEKSDLGLFDAHELAFDRLWKYFKKKYDIAIFIARPNIEPAPLTVL